MARIVSLSAFVASVTLFSGAIFAQTGDVTPKFGVTDVHVSAPSTMQIMRGGFYRGGRYELRNATMVDLIRTAWSMDPDKVTGGPGWLVKDRFDVIAIAPADSTQDTLKIMLQELLKDRFNLVLHTATKDYPAYAMTVGKKLQIKQAAGTEEIGCKVQQTNSPPPQEGGGGRAIFMVGNNGGAPIRLSLDEPLTFACRNITMPAFAATGIRSMIGSTTYLSNSPVIDKTGLEGAWNFDVRFSFRLNGAIQSTGNVITLFEAFEKLGLKLDQIQVPMPVVAVDSVNEKPTDNLPGVTKALPAPPTEFEVADIRPTDPNAEVGPGRGGLGGLFSPGGRVNMRNQTLKNLIMTAWNMNTPELIVGGPKSMETNHWDIVAKAPTPELAPGATALGINFDIDGNRIMLQALLKERFGLKVHTEDRQVAGYALVAVKPKLRKADPSNRPECKEGPGPDGKDPRVGNSMAGRLVTCWNMTVAQFATELKNTAGGYLGQYPPVVDATGIEGNYDITINFSGAGVGQIGGGGRGGDAGAGGGNLGASEPNGAITLFEAVEKQLGLKLEQRKVTGSALVIDHADDAPSDN